MLLLTALLACTGDGSTTTPQPDPTGDTGEVQPFVEDRFDQDIVEPVRIAFVVDPSWVDGVNSIEDALEPAIDDFLYANPQHKFAVLNADVSGNGSGLFKTGWIGWPVPPSALNFGPPGGPPAPRQSIYASIEQRGEDNDEFLDGGKNLHFVILIDKPDGSDDERQTLEEFLEWAEDVPTYDSLKVSAIIPADQIDNYKDLVNQTDGVLYDVGSFQTALITILRDAIDLRTTFALSEEPRTPPEELDVIISDVPFVFAIDEDYAYDPAANSITFVDFVPPPGSTVRVRYDRITGTTPASSSTDDSSSGG